jgi:hypothetical protein
MMSILLPFSFLMYQVVLYQCINLDNLICCTPNSVSSQCNISYIEFVGVDLEWMLEWHIWSSMIYIYIYKFIKEHEMKDKIVLKVWLFI